MEKYCICTWIDESTGSQRSKEKYMPNQDVELIRFVFALDKNSKLIQKKEYTYDRSQKKACSLFMFSNPEWQSCLL